MNNMVTPETVTATGWGAALCTLILGIMSLFTDVSVEQAGTIVPAGGIVIGGLISRFFPK